MTNSFVHYLLPHESNNFKPRTLHPSFITFYIVLILLIQFSFRIIKFAHPEVLGFATDINVETLLNLTNLQRAQAGLAPLKLDSELSNAAAAKAQNMFSKDYWAHNAPDGTTPWFFISQAGYKYIYAGENLAKDFNDSTGVVNAWMNSPSHKENILKSEYQDIGFAIVNGRLSGEETTLVVQMFGTKQSENVASNPVIIPPVAAAVNPTSTPIPSLNPVPTSAPAVVTGSLSMGVYHQPLVNYFTTTKNLATILTGGLLILLIGDGFFIWKKKIVRISGHNLAHVIFLVGLLGALWVTSQGVIL